MARHDRRRTPPGGEPGRTPGGDYAIQRGWLNPDRQLFGQVTSRARQTQFYGASTSTLTNTEAPKGTDLSVHGSGYLDFVAAELNNRPRKTLAWKTPAEALDTLLSKPSNPPGVAMTG